MSRNRKNHTVTDWRVEFQMKEVLHTAGMVTMGQDGMLKAVEGLTTLDEVPRGEGISFDLSR